MAPCSLVQPIDFPNKLAPDESREAWLRKSPIAKPANYDKATVTKMLSDSYDFVIAALQGLDPACTRPSIWKAARWRDSRCCCWRRITRHTIAANASSILRAKGIKPVDYDF